MPLAAVAGIGLAGSIGSALLGSNAANNAAETQANAANQAAQLQYQASQNALDFQKQQWNQTQANQAPWLQYGGGALSNLGYLLGVNPNTSLGVPQNQSTGVPGAQQFGQTGTQSPTVANGGIRPQAGALQAVGGYPSESSSGALLSGSGNLMPTGGPAQAIGAPTDGGSAPAPSGAGEFGSLMQGYGQQFTAPTGLTEQNDPGYQARLKLGTDALQKSAAARGGVLTGGVAQGLNQFAQDYASNEYNNVYNRALQGYGTNYNVWSNDQNNQFNRLAALAGVGQTAANNLSTAGQNASNNVSSNLLNTASQMGQQYNNAAAANASGYVGAANAWGGALGGIGNNLSNLYILNKMGSFGGGASATGGPSIGLSGWGTGVY